ncbi:cell envelope integrity protein CreD [Tunicatimonas pelagia]|uniref:cell envelope integrity protein CreD n=1 Tax=Tunicatimonas pelagia TaxID=931531 RepID=UPI00266570E2|nr:cell envelope integrity protein CreD [Tunicatimonas pelagia]WKN45768.1 cell envelope integrity protein CreD [Tunicatimonas pelagia]
MSASDQTLYERLNRWVRNSVTLRLISIGILVLLLLIPTAMIESLIHERSRYREDAIQNISSLWSNAQTIGGPILTVPYEVITVAEDNRTRRSVQYIHVLPDSLGIRVKILPEKRARGIYQAIVYQAQLQIEGTFTLPDWGTVGVDSSQLLRSETALSLGIPDMRGINQAVAVEWNSHQYTFEPGVAATDVLPSGVQTRVPLIENNTLIPFRLALDLNGSQSLQFLPMGRITRIDMTSPWPHPSFSGSFLPDEREVGEQGFSAYWEVLHLNRNFPQVWKNSQFRFNLSNRSAMEPYVDRYALPEDVATTNSSYAFGVNLLQAVDTYQKSLRTVKYAIMFIALTFLIFFFTEIRHYRRIHPIQYILVGLALCLFFALLLAISEHVSFALAYVIASLATIALVGVYVRGVLKDNKLTGLVVLLLLLLYGFIFILLQLQDYALLVGSLALFAILAAVMYLSRQVNWYALSENISENKD